MDFLSESRLDMPSIIDQLTDPVATTTTNRLQSLGNWLCTTSYLASRDERFSLGLSTLMPLIAVSTHLAEADQDMLCGRSRKLHLLPNGIPRGK